MKPNLVTVLGPTAVGKTCFAVKLANKFNGEIISADSRQVYKNMDLGTGKDYQDYNIAGNNIPYHLIDIVDPHDEYNLYKFQSDFYKTFKILYKKNKLPFLVGGTGLYIDSILRKYQLKESSLDNTAIKQYQCFSLDELKSKLLSIKPNLHNTTDLNEKDRLIKALIIAETKNTENVNTQQITSLTIGIKAEREIVKQRITVRLKKRLQSGMIEEVEKLIDEGVTTERLKLFGLEYKFVAMYLSGELNYNDMFQKLNSAIHKFAKRQMTWFRKMEKEGTKIHWLENNEFNAAVALIKNEFEL